MEFLFTEKFKKDYKKSTNDVKKAIQGKLRIMVDNPYHPSLRTKKIQGREDILECSINMSIRMTWQYYEGKILLRAVGDHDYTLKNP